MADNVFNIDGKRVRRSPSDGQQARLEARRRAEAECEDHDGVVRAATGAPTHELLRIQVAELARETAALKFDRLHASDSRARERLSSRRVRALRALAAAVVELHRAEATDGLPPPARTRQVLELLLADVLAAGAEVLDAATGERLAVAARRRVQPLLDELSGAPG